MGTRCDCGALFYRCQDIIALPDYAWVYHNFYKGVGLINGQLFKQAII